MPPPPTEGPKPAMFERLRIRLRPEDVGFRTGQPTGRGRIDGWFAFADEEPIDAIALLLAADAFPPAVFNTELPVAWVPTVELTVHVRGVPAPGPLRCSFVSRFIHDGLLDEEGAIWDSSGSPRRPVPPARPRRPRPGLTSERRRTRPQVSGGGTIGVARAGERRCRRRNWRRRCRPWPTDATVRRMTDFVRWLKITIGQPWRRACRSSRPSGLTATGWPTASSIGRSLAESLYA